MNATTKRFIKSTAETFLVTFGVTAYVMISPAIDKLLESGAMPTKELLVSALFAGLIAATKVSIKSIREFVIPRVKKWLSDIMSKALGLPLESNDK